jgi:hypothetical protein
MILIAILSRMYDINKARLHMSTLGECQLLMNDIEGYINNFIDPGLLIAGCRKR